jgi:Spy/CpxP family protein refolding chaperone
MNKLGRNKWIIYVTVLLLIANMVTLTMLWINNKHARAFNQRGGSLFEFISKELQFTPIQKEQYEKLKQLHHKDSEPMQDSLRLSKEAFFSLLKQQNVSDTLVMQQYATVALAEKNIALLNFRHFQQIRAICNAEQQQKFDTILLEVVGRIGSQRPPNKPGEFRPPMQNGENAPPPEDKGNGERPPPPPEDRERMGPPPAHEREDKQPPQKENEM